MSKGSAMNMIHLLERMNEPLGFGLRGGGGGQGDSMIYYYYDDKSMMDNMIDLNAMKDTMTMVRGRMSQAKDQGMNVKMEPIPPRPSLMPDLKLINELCPKHLNFCYFVPNHRRAFSILKQAFMMQSNTDEVYRLACACRDSPMINPQLFVYSFCSSLVSRPDTQNVQIPSHVEISPDSYCSSDVVRQAIKMAHMPEVAGGRSSSSSKEAPPPVIMVDKNLTGRGSNPEQRMWYFREDILVNSHHFHWHIVFPACSPKDPKMPGYRDRRGELFYYMHHSMIARYDTERLCNGLPRTRKIDFSNLVVEEGYFGKLTSENSGMHWGTRQANTRISDVRNDIFSFRVEDLTRWRDRILESIDLGYYVQKDMKSGKEGRVMLDEFKGIDVLGDIVENSSSLSPHLQYYGDFGFHNMGHVLIAFSNDPRAKFNEGAGPMGDVSTAMRDPAFYRWHKYIDHLFDLYKMTLTPYPLDSDGKSKFPLRWRGVDVVPGSFHVKAYDSPERNKLRTFWDYKDVDLSRGLDFRKNINEGVKRSTVMGRFTHINHGQFDYFLKIDNKTGKPARGTIRIFMAPRHDEHGNPFKLGEQRLLFFEMDKQSRTLKPGVNDIRIMSKDSSVTLRDENGSSFKKIEEVHREAKSKDDVVGGSQCSCGWPQHMLIPRGSGGGTEYDLFVIVTDGSVDMVPDVDRKTSCASALSFCGVLNRKYPDSRPMGYPFDRRPYSIKVMEGPQDLLDQCPAEEVPVPDLDSYVKDIKNSGKVVVSIVHDNMMKKDAVEMGEQVMRPDGKCIQLKDYYNGNGGGGGGGSSNGGGGGNNGGGGIQGGDRGGRGNNWGQNPNRYPPQRPSNVNQQQQQQYQWGGPTGGGGGGYRRGREHASDEDEWEHLAGGEY